MDTSPASSSTDRLPDWLAEALDVLSARRRVVVATAIGLVLLGAIVALVAPSILPARAIVGAAVGIAAALLATALALAMDASDLVVRGSRHVRAAGGTVDVRVGRQHDDVGPLLAAVARHASNGRVRVALSSASRKAGVPGARASALAEALARTGRKVLLTDLTRGGTPAAGLSDVITGARTLPEVVRFEQQLYLARLAVGSDPDAAVSGFASWVEGLPSDLEVLVVALPPLAERGVLKAANAMDLTLVLVEVDRTERVDLIASLDAVDAAGLTSELVLVDPQRTTAEVRGAGAPDTTADTTTAESSEEPPDEPTLAGSLPEEDRSEETHPDEEASAGRPFEEPEAADAAPDLPAEDAMAAAGPADATVADEVPRHEPSAADAVADPAPDVEDWQHEPDAADEELAAAADEDVLAEIGLDVPPETEDVDAREGTDEPDESRDGDATAEIMMPATAAGNGLTSIWDEPDDGPPPVPDESEVEHEPAAEPDPEPAADAEPAAAAPEPAMPRALSEPEPAVPEPALEPEPVSEPEAAVEPEPVSEPAPQRDEAPVPEPVMAHAEPARSEPAESGLDPAAMEVARASAALHQLAQQIWDRDER